MCKSSIGCAEDGGRIRDGSDPQCIQREVRGVFFFFWEVEMLVDGGWRMEDGGFANEGRR